MTDDYEGDTPGVTVPWRMAKAVLDSLKPGDTLPNGLVVRSPDLSKPLSNADGADCQKGTQLTDAELAVVVGSLDPVVLQIKDPTERLRALCEFMNDALQYHLVGPEHMIRQPIRAMDEDGKEFLVTFEMGEPDVGISDGWTIEPAEAE